MAEVQGVPSVAGARRRLVVAVVVALSVVACGRNRGDPNREVAARVNGAPIPLSAVASNLPPGTDAAKSQGAKRVDGKKLQDAIDRELLWQAAQKQNLTVPDLDAKVEQLAAQLAAKAGGHGQPAAPSEPTAALKEKARQTVIIEHYLRSTGLADAPVAEEEIAQYYEKNKAALTSQESRHVRHVLVNAPAGSKPEVEAAARAKIDEARKQIASKKLSFEDAAKKYSDCATAPKGGDLGEIRHGYMPRAFDDVAFTLPAHRLSDVVRTQHGFHVLEVMQVTPAKVPELSEAHDFIATYLRMGANQRKIAEHLASLKSQAKIVYYLN